MFGKGKLVCNLGWIHIGISSGLKCSLLVLKLSFRYFVVFCAFLKWDGLDLGIFCADNSQIASKNSWLQRLISQNTGKALSGCASLLSSEENKRLDMKKLVFAFFWSALMPTLWTMCTLYLSLIPCKKEQFTNKKQFWRGAGASVICLKLSPVFYNELQ